MTTSSNYHGGGSIPLLDDPKKFRPKIWLINFELQTAFQNAVHFSIPNKPELKKVEITTSAYFQIGNGIPLVDDPENFRPQI